MKNGYHPTKAHLLYANSDPQVMRLLISNTIGLSILSETLLTASRVVFSTTSKLKKSEATRCFLWVQGTGLDYLLQRYQLDYNANEIRSTFNYYMRHRPNV